MSQGARGTWRDDGAPPPAIPRPGPFGWLLVALRGGGIVTVLALGVLLILRRKGLRIVEAPVAMQPRTAGASRIFRSWWVVGKYMLQTSLLCIARVGFNPPPSALDD